MQTEFHTYNMINFITLATDMWKVWNNITNFMKDIPCFPLFLTYTFVQIFAVEKTFRRTEIPIWETNIFTLHYADNQVVEDRGFE